MTSILTLCWEFFKIGLFTVGGGLAAIPFLYELADKYHWYTTQMVTDMIAISQSTPGPIAINMATYVGYTVSGAPGAVLASLAIALPSMILSALVARALNQFRNNQHVKNTFSALRACVTGLILFAAFELLSSVLYVDGRLHWLELSIALGLLVLTELKPLKKLHPIVFISLGAVIGIALKL